MAFKYQGRSAESIKRAAAESSGNYDDWLKAGPPRFKPRDGENTIRIMPATSTWDIEKWGDSWGITVYLHGNVGVDRSTYLCSMKMNGDPCAICDAREKVLDDKEEADALRASKRTLAWIIDRTNEADGPQLWSMPQASVAKEILDRSTDRKTGAAVLIDHPDDGFDIMFRKSGTGLRTEYTAIQIDRDPSYLSKNAKKQDAWLDIMMDKPLPEMLVYYPYEYLEKAVRGKASRREEDEDDRGGGRDRRGRDDDRRGGRERERSKGREEERGSGRSRGDEVEDRRGRRSRVEEDDGEKDRGRDREDGRERDSDRTERRRSRDTDDEDGGRRRGGDEEDREDRRRGGDEDEGRSGDDSRRARGRDEDEGRGGSRRGDRASESRSARSGEDSGSERRRSSDSSEDEESPRRRRASEEDDAPKAEGGTERRRSRDTSGEDEVAQAKEQIGRLRSGRR